VLPSAALTLRLPPVRGFVQSADALFQEALLGDAEARTGGTKTLPGVAQ
jgi:hypothetical protein